MGTYAVRFRHTSGIDIGPFPFSSSSSILELKERLLQEWPKDGSVPEYPATLAEIRLISGGKFLDNSTTLHSLAKVIGQPQPDLVVTMHIIVRPPPPPKAAVVHAKEQAQKCMCTIC